MIKTILQADIFLGYFPQEASACDQFLRHKAYVMSPTRLAKDGVRVNMLVHNQGEYVITFPRGYHAGFNLGFNCAESVNFALDSWVDLGRRAKVCRCVNHRWVIPALLHKVSGLVDDVTLLIVPCCSVRIDMDELLGEQEKRIKTEQELIDAIENEKSSDGAQRRRKRPRPSIVDGDGILDNDGIPVNGMTQKKTIIPLSKKSRAAIVQAPTYFPCILCPNIDENELVPVFEPSATIQAMRKSADGIARAHGACINSTPEVWVEDREVDGRIQTVVVGVDGISKDRWNLKCQSCKDKKLATRGSKLQCVNVSGLSSPLDANSLGCGRG